ncbi:MAG: dTDP-4-dehydrorhamnose reductase [Vicinamibacterales bacterium]
MRIVVVGARGQLGAAVVHAARVAHDVVPLDRAALDIGDAAAVRTRMHELRPDVVINCAAYNAVDAAEDRPEDAIRGNALAVRNLVRALPGATLVHYSSDFVFDGTASRPYVETDTPNPLSVYGMSKLMGEWFARDAARAYVLRVESLFGRAPDAAPAKGSVAAIVNALLAGQTPRVFEDRTVTPTSVTDCARATLALLEHQAPPGVYHCVNSGSCTWLGLAQEVARILALPPRFETVRFDEVTLKARRPKYCALSNEKLIATGAAMPDWQHALRESLAAASPQPR